MDRKLWFFIALLCFGGSAMSQDGYFIKVQFIYGSRPLKAHKQTEQKWFGGMLGGHVGIEDQSDVFYSFEIHGKNKIIGRKATNSVYCRETASEFWSIMKTDGACVKKATVIIPLSAAQKQTFDSITNDYLAHVPYGYAVFGMRCAASTYEILAQMNILPQYSRYTTWRKIFYPRRLRKRLFKEAETNGWTVSTEAGAPTRKWEKDAGRFRNSLLLTHKPVAGNETSALK